MQQPINIGFRRRISKTVVIRFTHSIAKGVKGHQFQTGRRHSKLDIEHACSSILKAGAELPLNRLGICKRTRD